MPTRILIAYHTVEGHTAQIAQRIAQRLIDAGADVEVHTTNDAPPPTGFDGVILGDSVHWERHSRSLIAYARTHANELSALPTGLFQVCLYSASHDVRRKAKVHGYTEKAIEKAGWAPDIVGEFAGALAYTQYGWIKRHRMHAIAKREGEDTNTGRDYSFTDWDAVDHFADDALAMIRATTGHTLG